MATYFKRFDVKGSIKNQLLERESSLTFTERDVNKFIIGITPSSQTAGIISMQLTDLETKEVFEEKINISLSFNEINYFITLNDTVNIEMEVNKSKSNNGTKPCFTSKSLGKLMMTLINYLPLKISDSMKESFVDFIKVYDYLSNKKNDESDNYKCLSIPRVDVLTSGKKQFIQVMYAFITEMPVSEFIIVEDKEQFIISMTDEQMISENITFNLFMLRRYRGFLKIVDNQELVNYASVSLSKVLFQESVEAIA